MLCSPTKVAAANCQALLPVSSHLGEGTSIDLPLDVFCCDDAHNPRFPNMGPYERNQDSLRQEPCQPRRPIESLAKPEASWKIEGHPTAIAHKLGKDGRRIYLDQMRAGCFAQSRDLGMDRGMAIYPIMSRNRLL